MGTYVTKKNKIFKENVGKVGFVHVNFRVSVEALTGCDSGKLEILGFCCILPTQMASVRPKATFHSFEPVICGDRGDATTAGSLIIMRF